MKINPRMLIALILSIVIGATGGWAASGMRSQQSRSESSSTIIVVHTGQTKTLHFNPLTHEAVENEMADGNVMITVQPKSNSTATGD